MLSVLKGAEGYLAQRGVEAPRLSAEHLLAKVLALSRLQLYLQHDRPLGAQERATLRDLVGRRGRHEPLHYLLGEIEFAGLCLQVDRHVLVPRPETEHLVTLAAELAPKGARVVDLGTGSGAIALGLAHARPDLVVLATDCSEAALAVAARNAARTGLAGRVRFARGDWWEAVGAAERFDLLVSNPPYVDPQRPELLADDVREWEPALALFGAVGDPASCYRAIAGGLAAHLAPGAWCLFETGVGVADLAQAALRSCAVLESLELRLDLAGLPRYLLGRIGP